MARGRKGKAAQAIVRVHAVPVEDLQEAAVERLTVRFRELRYQLLRDAVETTIELGELLQEGRPLVRRSWGSWLEQLEISPQTAANYIHLAQLARKQPRIIQRWKELGPTKLYRVWELTGEGRRRLLAPARSEELLQMNMREFAEVTQPYRRATGRRVTPDMRAHGLRLQVQSWSRRLEEVQVGRIRSTALRTGLRADIKELRRALRTLETSL